MLLLLRACATGFWGQCGTGGAGLQGRRRR